MPISSLLLGLTLAILVLPFIARPFLRRAGQARSLQAAGASGSEAPTRESALLALRDLDFDFQTGKIAEADYAPLRQQLLGAAARAAPQTGKRTKAMGGWPSTEVPIDEAIERAVQARRLAQVRGHLHSPAGESPDEAIEISVLELSQGPSGTVLVCRQCGLLAQSGDHFCHGCGAALKVTCPACHSPVSADDKFCGRCGAGLIQMESL